jgi:tetratricopeptide (TPR) repeat protein
VSADRALQGFSVPGAVAAYDRAVDIADRLGDAKRVASLSGRRGQASLGSGDLPGAIASFDRMVAVARRIGDGDLKALALGYRGFAELLSHDFDTAERTLREALTIEGPEVVDGRALAAVVLRFLLQVLDRHHEVEAVEQIVRPLLPEVSEAVWWERQVIAILDRNWRGEWGDLAEPAARARGMTGDLVQRQWLSWNTGLSAAGLGDYDLALELLRLTIERGERAGEVMGQARALNTLGWVHGDLGDHDGGITWNRRCLEFIAPLAFPDPEIEANTRLNLADDFMRLGRLDDAAGELDWVHEVVRDPDSDPWMMWRYRQHFLHSAGELCLRRDDPEGALSYGESCLAAALKSESTKNVVKAERLRGQALAALGRTAEAGRALDEAVTLARDLGNPPQLWRTLLAVAELARSREDREGEILAASEARQLVDDVAAGLSDAPLRSALLGSPEHQTIVAMVG